MLKWKSSKIMDVNFAVMEMEKLYSPEISTQKYYLPMCHKELGPGTL